MAERILVTGATGFVGSQLMAKLAVQPSVTVRGVVRSKITHASAELVAIGEINSNTDWSEALQGQRVIIHTAGRAHVMEDLAIKPLTAFRSVNVAGTLNLARQAAASGVERFVFISSIKVNGEQTRSGSYFTAEDAPAPEDPYGISKWEAEQGLQQVARETGMEVVIVRPPLVYGPGVKGNFATMIKLVQKGLPLPIGSVRNQRSLVGLDNLISLLTTCINHPAAANQIFLVSDGQDLSTTELLRALAKATGRPSRLIPVPAKVLEFGAKLLGKEAMAQRLLGSLQVDISKTRELLGWEPPVSVEEGLQRCVTAPSF